MLLLLLLMFFPGIVCFLLARTLFCDNFFDGGWIASIFVASCSHGQGGSGGMPTSLL
jgi:hypothetical protein